MDRSSKPFTKGYDMPPDMDVSMSYGMFMHHVLAGRAVGICPVERPDGEKGTYIYSGELPFGALPPSQQKNDPDGWKQNCLRMITGARRAAIKNDCKPLP